MTAAHVFSLINLPDDLKRWNTPGQWALLAIIALHVNDELQYAWPGTLLLSRTLRITQRHVKRLRRELIRQKAIKYVPGGGRRTSRYWIVDACAEPSAHGGTGDSSVASEVTTTPPDGDTSVSPQGSSPSPDLPLLTVKRGKKAARIPRADVDPDSQRRRRDGEGTSIRNEDPNEASYARFRMRTKVP